MLVRCEHCGSALPQEASKCFKCGKERTPHHLAEKRPISGFTLGQFKKRWGKLDWFLTTIFLLFFILGIVLLIVGSTTAEGASSVDSCGGFYYNKNEAAKGLLLCVFGVVSVLLSILCEFVHWCKKAFEIKKSIVSKNKKSKSDEAEYEQRIRDFINR